MLTQRITARLARRLGRRPVPTRRVLYSNDANQTAGADREPLPSAVRSARRDGGARRRIQLCAGAFLAAFSILAVRAFSIATDAELRAEAAVARELQAGPRPEIVDRNGVLLAANLPMRGIEVAGPEVWDAEETVRRIAWVAPQVDREWLHGRLAERKYASVPQPISPAQERALFEMGLPGVTFVDRAKRYYPQKDLASHLIGRAAPGQGGIEGLEAALDATSAVGGDGRALRASIDVRVQQALEFELGSAMTRFNAKAAWGGVIDVETGEMIAMASLPDFDPNRPGERAKATLSNHFVHDNYELGSIFKVFTAAAAYDAGLADEETQYDARAPLEVADWTIRDYHGENRVLTFGEVVRHSSNIGAAMMAADLKPRGLKSALGRLGLLDRLPIPLIERSAPLLPQKWGPVETATIAYGHGLAVTPLHALSAFAAVVNGGVYRTPVFVAAADASRSGRRVFAEETSVSMRRVLRSVITEGTASKADASGYYAIGKTGTAEKAMKGGYSKREKVTSFVGAFPGYAPRYAVLVSLDDPQPAEGDWGHSEAGWNAAPTFARVVERIGPLLKVPPATPTADPTVEAMLFNRPGRGRTRLSANDRSAR
ncbi:MAG: penicillin-binding protein 2 [Pseudomonadota bacterium]